MRQRHTRSLLKKFVVIMAMTALFFMAGTGTFAYFRYSRPLDPLTAQEVAYTEQKPAPIITWPLAQASFGTTADGILASKPGQTPQPTASTIKLLTVLTVLKEKPLALGEQGPTLTMNQDDIAIYNRYVANNGSVANVQVGEQLTEYQLLQGILIRSANNFADSLALWAFGDHVAYQKAATAMARELGMTQTTVGTDASGLSPTTTSTAEDLTRLGIAAMQNEVIRDIVKQSSVTLPIDGTKPSTNWLLGTDGVVGIKTGTTNEAGGVFIIASDYTPEGESPITIVGAVQGASTTAEAMTQAQQLANTAKSLFVKQTVIKKGDELAAITTPWGVHTTAIAAKDISVFGWQGTTATPKIVLQSLQAPLQKGTVVGRASVGKSATDLILTEDIQGPSWWWRITGNNSPNRR